MVDFSLNSNIKKNLTKTAISAKQNETKAKETAKTAVVETSAKTTAKQVVSNLTSGTASVSKTVETLKKELKTEVKATKTENKTTLTTKVDNKSVKITTNENIKNVPITVSDSKIATAKTLTTKITASETKINTVGTVSSASSTGNVNKLDAAGKKNNDSEIGRKKQTPIADALRNKNNLNKPLGTLAVNNKDLGKTGSGLSVSAPTLSLKGGVDDKKIPVITKDLNIKEPITIQNVNVAETAELSSSDKNKQQALKIIDELCKELSNNPEKLQMLQLSCAYGVNITEMDGVSPEVLEHFKNKIPTVGEIKQILTDLINATSDLKEIPTEEQLMTTLKTLVSHTDVLLSYRTFTAEDLAKYNLDETQLLQFFDKVDNGYKLKNGVSFGDFETVAAVTKSFAGDNHLENVLANKELMTQIANSMLSSDEPFTEASFMNALKSELGIQNFSPVDLLIIGQFTSQLIENITGITDVDAQYEFLQNNDKSLSELLENEEPSETNGPNKAPVRKAQTKTKRDIAIDTFLGIADGCLGALGAAGGVVGLSCSIASNAITIITDILNGASATDIAVDVLFAVFDIGMAAFPGGKLVSKLILKNPTWRQMAKGFLKTSITNLAKGSIKFTGNNYQNAIDKFRIPDYKNKGDNSDWGGWCNYPTEPFDWANTPYANTYFGTSIESILNKTGTAGVAISVDKDGFYQLQVNGQDIKGCQAVLPDEYGNVTFKYTDTNGHNITITMNASQSGSYKVQDETTGYSTEITYNPVMDGDGVTVVAQMTIYDAADNVVSNLYQNADGSITGTVEGKEYSQKNGVTTVFNPETGLTTQMVTNSDGTSTTATITDGSGKVISTTTTVTNVDGSKTSTTKDSSGNVISTSTTTTVINSDGSTTSTKETYDKSGAKTSQTVVEYYSGGTDDGHIKSSTYNEYDNGVLISTTTTRHTDNGDYVESVYDARMGVTTHYNSFGEVTSQSYDWGKNSPITAFLMRIYGSNINMEDEAAACLSIFGDQDKYKTTLISKGSSENPNDKPGINGVSPTLQDPGASNPYVQNEDLGLDSSYPRNYIERGTWAKMADFLRGLGYNVPDNLYKQWHEGAATGYDRVQCSDLDKLVYKYGEDFNKLIELYRQIQELNISDFQIVDGRIYGLVPDGDVGFMFVNVEACYDPSNFPKNTSRNKGGINKDKITGSKVTTQVVNNKVVSDDAVKNVAAQESVVVKSGTTKLKEENKENKFNLNTKIISQLGTKKFSENLKKF